MTAPHPSESGPLRAEHDTLAQQLATRRSIDDVRRGAWGTFALVIAGGIAGRLAWDRWGPHAHRVPDKPPFLFVLALGAALVCLATAAVSFLRARRLMRRETQDFARLRQLRRQLGIDP